MKRIEVWADVACPFTHAGLRRLVEARRDQAAPVAIRIRAWPLEWVNGSPIDPEQVTLEIAALRAAVTPELFAGFDESTFPSTSLPAFGLAAAAYALNDEVGEAVSLAVRDALFEHGLDIADAAVISKIAGEFGVEPLDAAATVSSVQADWERGKARAVQGSPHFFVGERDWFCPTLVIRHDDGTFDVETARATVEEFYATAFG